MERIDCNRIQIYLIDFIDKTLDPVQTEQIRHHLKSCTDCQEELDKTLSVLNELEQVKNVDTPESLKMSFLKMLQDEKIKIKEGSRHSAYNRSVTRWIYNPFSQIAAGIAILLSGILLGFVLDRQPRGIQQVEQLQDEIIAMKEMLFLAKLDQSSASKRLQAVSYVKDFQQVDPKIIQALIHTMNNDDNINVRMAAIHGLEKFTGQHVVRKALVESLKKQEDALLQITLINILVEIQEKDAVDVMKDLLLKEETIDAVKQMAEKGLTTFI